MESECEESVEAEINEREERMRMNLPKILTEVYHL
jgi:hypothetical protein